MYKLFSLIFIFALLFVVGIPLAATLGGFVGAAVAMWLLFMILIKICDEAS